MLITYVRFSRYVHDRLAQLGTLPSHAEPTLKEAGRIVVQLEHLAQELEIAEARKRRRDSANLELIRDTGLPVDVAGEILRVHTTERFKPALDDAAWNEEVGQLNRTILQNESARYGRGQKEAEALIGRPKGWVERTPALRKLLSLGTLRSHARALEILVEHVRRHNIP